MVVPHFQYNNAPPSSALSMTTERRNTLPLLLLLLLWSSLSLSTSLVSVGASGSLRRCGSVVVVIVDTVIEIFASQAKETMNKSIDAFAVAAEQVNPRPASVFDPFQIRVPHRSAMWKIRTRSTRCQSSRDLEMPRVVAALKVPDVFLSLNPPPHIDLPCK